MTTSKSESTTSQQVEPRSRGQRPANRLDELRMIDPHDLAELMGVSRRQISRWLADKTLPAYDFVSGQTRRWRYVTVLRWMEQHARRVS